MIKQIIIEALAEVLEFDIEECSLIALFLVGNCFGILLENIGAGTLLAMDWDYNCRLVLLQCKGNRSYKAIVNAAGVDIAFVALVGIERNFRMD